MGLVSNTGLLAAVPKQHSVKRKNQVKPSDLVLEQLCEVTPAPYVLRPYAGLYNPFSHTCSVLCNHPANKELKMTVKKIKDNLTSENKDDEEITTYPKYYPDTDRDKDLLYRSGQYIVTEDMLKRYTQTDSRPLTPTNTLASCRSRGSRRCLTPDETFSKTTLVVDLRRSHSQETIFYHGYTSDLTVPTLPSVNMSDGTSNPPDKNRTSDQLPSLDSSLVLIKRANVNEHINVKNKKERSQLKALNLAKPNKSQSKEGAETARRKTKPVAEAKGSGGKRDSKKDKGDKNKDTEEISVSSTHGDDAAANSNEIRRRGKRRRKGRPVGSDRLTSAGLAAQTQQDPETQIAGIDTDSNNASSRSSVTPDVGDDDIVPLPSIRKTVLAKKSDSFLDDDILKFLHREVDEEAIETEFDTKRRYVLKEALRTRPDRPYGEEMQTLLKEMKIPAVCLGDWLHIPRVFSRQNAQFSLPIDYKELESLTPMQYAARYVTVKKSKQLLYLTVLRKFRPDGYRMPIKNLEQGLKLMMGGMLTEENVQKFKETMDWDSYQEQENIPDEIVLKSLEDEYSTATKVFSGAGDIEPQQTTIKFQTWCGLCGICERMFGRFPPRSQDLPDGIELSDFTMIEAKLPALKVHSGLVEIIHVIKKR